MGSSTAVPHLCTACNGQTSRCGPLDWATPPPCVTGGSIPSNTMPWPTSETPFRCKHSWNPKAWKAKRENWRSSTTAVSSRVKPGGPPAPPSAPSWNSCSPPKRQDCRNTPCVWPPPKANTTPATTNERSTLMSWKADGSSRASGRQHTPISAQSEWHWSRWSPTTFRPLTSLPCAIETT